MVKIEFHFDFGSPNAYLSHLVIPEIERHTNARFDYVPVLLGGVFKLTNNRSPAESLRGIRNKPEYERLETQRFIRRHGITRFQANPFFPVNTLMMMRGAIAARSLGVFERYLDEMYRHMWAEPKNMDDPAVFRSAITASRSLRLNASRKRRVSATSCVRSITVLQSEVHGQRCGGGTPRSCRSSNRQDRRTINLQPPAVRRLSASLLHDPEVRKILYTTNAIESLNAQVRKAVRIGAVL